MTTKYCCATCGSEADEEMCSDIESFLATMSETELQETEGIYLCSDVCEMVYDAMDDEPESEKKVLH